MRSLLGVVIGLLLTSCAVDVGGVSVGRPSFGAQDPEPRSAVAAQGDDTDASQDPDASPGYPIPERVVGGPTDVEVDLATSFPKQGSLLGDVVPARDYFGWKEDLYADTGIKLGISYQSVFQKASDITTGFPLPGDGTDVAAGGWLLIEAKWDAYNRGEDWQGGIAAALDWRHTYGSAAEPSRFQGDTGSLWPTDFTIIAWDPWLPVLYWEQWGAKDRFVARVGNQVALQIWDFFRFKDGRTSFTSSQFTAPMASIPTPPPGLGVAFEWWPIEDSPLYLVGTVNDMNAEPGEFSWDNAFEYGQFFYGLEVGYNWGKFPTNFDHLHLGLFYADERDTAAPVFPNAAGGGFKLAGSKQWDRLVGFASYTYNTSEGGGVGLTCLEHTANLGVAYVRPLDVRGEIALGATWGRPIQDFGGAPAVWNDRRDQYGAETYWKILLTPDLWVTPGVQMIFNPSFNPDTDFLAIGTFKFRLFF